MSKQKLNKIGIAFLTFFVASSATLASTVEISKNGRGGAGCSSGNPRCLFDLSPRFAGASNAESDAKSNAERACLSSGGSIIDGSVVSSSCTAVTAWIDRYDCIATYKVSCNVSSVQNARATEIEVESCINSVGRRSLELAPIAQTRTACLNAITNNYKWDLFDCITESVKHDALTAGSTIVGYCDLAGRSGMIPKYISALKTFEGYGFEYVWSRTEFN